MRDSFRPLAGSASDPIWRAASPELCRAARCISQGTRTMAPDPLAARPLAEPAALAIAAAGHRDRPRLARPLPGLRQEPRVQRLSCAWCRNADHCGAPLGLARADDAPPYFTILIVGHIVVPLMLIMQRMTDPPTWLLSAIFVPLTLVLSLGLLRPIKGGTVGLMLSLNMLKTEPDRSMTQCRPARPCRPGGRGADQPAAVHRGRSRAGGGRPRRREPVRAADGEAWADLRRPVRAASGAARRPAGVRHPLRRRHAASPRSAWRWDRSAR